MINWSTTDIAGLEFGDSHIVAARIRGKDAGSYCLTHAGAVDYDPSAAPAVIAGQLRQLWQETRMPTRTVCASLRSASLAVRYFSIPVMPQDDLKNALQLKAEEALQRSRDEIVMGWHVNDGAGGAAVGTVSGLLAAAPTRDVERELEVLADAGLDPVILDIRGLAVANVYLALRNGQNDGAVCLVNMEPHSADVMVGRETGELYPHTIYCRDSTWAEKPGFLAENIRDVLRYTEFKLGWDSVRRVILAGVVPGDAAYRETLSGALNIPVEHWDPLPAIRIKSRLDPAAWQECSLVPALGLSIRRS